MRTRTVDAARGRWVSILSGMGVDESFLRKRHGPCPFCGGKDRYRFDDKEGNGTWFCSHCGAGRGIEFVMKLKMCDFKEACKVIDPLIGSSRIHTTSRKYDPMPMLIRISSECVLSKAGGIVSRYLSGRGLSLPIGLKEHGGLTYYDDERKPCGRYEAMIARLVSPDGKPVTLHATYLEGAKKAGVTSPKKLFPKIAPLQGACVRLYEFDSCVAIAEGIESAIAYHDIFGIPCMAATNATLLAQWKPPDGVSSVVIAGDNDDSFAGHNAAYHLAYRLRAAGVTVSVHIPGTVGFDWADVLEQNRRLDLVRLKA